jgi:hypothetical protein
LRYRDFLKCVHELLEPPTYFEIGIRHGDSLALARSASVGIDPRLRLRTALPSGVALFEETSDEYFDRPDPLEPFGGRPISLAFIDGMHLIEYALRDFVNVERHAGWTSVVVFDDVLPRAAEEASRKRHTRVWTGDVYKISAILARHRPDLACLHVGTEPTGLLLVLGLDPQSSLLDERYDDIVLEAVRPDPQRVPNDVFERRNVIEPEAVLEASFWELLREARAGEVPAKPGLRRLRRTLRSDFGSGIISGPLGRLLPSHA